MVPLGALDWDLWVTPDLLSILSAALQGMAYLSYWPCSTQNGHYQENFCFCIANAKKPGTRTQFVDAMAEVTISLADG
jgi:hypothetical protein